MKYDDNKKEPIWLKYVPASKREICRNNLEKKRLFELRKQLFNGEKSPNKSISYRNEPGLKKLRQTISPDEPNPSLKRLMQQCQDKVDYWLEEQKVKEKKSEKRFKH